MSCLLFPGRHHLLTTFQIDELRRITSADPSELRDINGQPLDAFDRIDTIIWAVTSANHFNTRRNPLPAYRRAAAIENAAAELDAESFVYMIDDIGHTPRFAEYVLKKIDVESHGRFRIAPDNTILGCSTPEVIEMYGQLGFRVLPFELADHAAGTYHAETPWQLIMRIVAAGRDWRKDDHFLNRVAPASQHLFLRYDVGDLVADLHDDPLLTEDGDITDTRDYATYVRAFDEGPRKYGLVRGLVAPGRIVDIGCCTGSIIREMTRDDTLRESDFYGIEAARPLYAECCHRKELGAFANDNVFFYQRDFMAGPAFSAGSVNAFTTFPLTHEIESYQGRPMLEQFIRLLFDQLAHGGRWINVDVVGPGGRDDLICMWLNRDDGRNVNYEREFPKDEREELRQYLSGLSTFARFLRFASDFRHEEGYRVKHDLIDLDRVPHIRLRLEDACEYLSKKDYPDNWQSEMHERFCFWGMAAWTRAVEAVGFRIQPASREFLNPWLVENRYEGKAALFTMSGGQRVPLAWPPSNMVLVAEKP